MNEIILEMKNINKAFPGVQALDNVQLTLRKGTVHALMGENGAGKSTLMKCLYGIYYKDSGEIIFDGQEVNFLNSKAAIDAGISMIHQELQPIPMMTVAENIFLGNYPKNGLFVDHDKMNAESKRFLDIVGLDVPPDTLLGNLTISQQQSVEIAKAISHDVKIVIMDEPTSSLTSTEVEKLFDIIRTLTSQGIAIIYISHKMDEILEISDEVTIMRDGKYVATHDAKNLTKAQIIHDMVGRELVNQFPDHVDESTDKVLLEVKNLTSPNVLSFKDCSFQLKQGEILGVAGLVGAQRSELMEAVFGLRDVEAGGQILIRGEEVEIKSPQDAIKNNMAFVTEDRRHSGIFGVLPVADNITIASIRNFQKPTGLLDESAMKEVVDHGITSLRIKTPSAKTRIENLSGGNQQKVVLSRWLATSPDILILDEPTRGIDVGAKYEIYEIIDALSREGKSIIMISSEMSEIMGMSDRIMVMCEGRISGYLSPEEATQEKIMELATAFMHTSEAVIEEVN
ncbi:sugar ABC transporter ATP-binding protein [Fundicoccus culcitae]|uniref:Ribose/galactose/methyl galactoside import ATP-binding protein n=1 Tax=Fundicoccus culcitae TaxID=2969821 RepID=A0ABY5P9T1_9LACT|nr:sugar ABC transporter ATP-binding protein [Fundicoccus culcitae]UUX35514.1 sugar ABC transporter ATP-binding protein [Fundicoccus culcitae]